MLMMSQPCDRKNWLSALVEKRGPWMTTTVPLLWTRIPMSFAASKTSSRSSGQYGSAEPTCAVSGPSKKVSFLPLVKFTNWSDITKSPGLMLGLQAPHRGRPEYPLDAELLEGVEVRAVRDHVRRELVVLAVPRDEGDALSLDVGEPHARAGCPVGCLQLGCLLRLEELVEPRPSNHADACDSVTHVRPVRLLL